MIEKLNQLKELHNLIREAPKGLQEYLDTTFGVLICVIVLWFILKFLLSKEFKQLYSLLGGGAKNVTKISKVITNEALKCLELPEPYPRLIKFFTIFSMVNNYLGILLFALYFFVFLKISLLSITYGLFIRIAALLLAMFCVYSVCFLFVQAETERIKLLSKMANKVE